MALSDSDREQTKKRKIRPVEAKTNLRWSDKQKVEAATTYLALGNLAMTGRVMGIPEITLRVWAATEWWKHLIDDLKQQERLELSSRLKRIVDAAHTVVENRLLNGDPMVTPKGEVIMRPVNMRDAHRVAVDLQNQRHAVEKLNKPVETVEGQADKLSELAEKFAEFATKKIEQLHDQKRTVDVPFVEIVDEAQVAQGDSLSDGILFDNDSGTDGEVVQETQGSLSQAG